MLPISDEGRVADLGSGLDAEQLAQHGGVLGLDEQQDERVDVALQPEHDSGHDVIRRAGGVNRVGQRQRQRTRHPQLDLAAQHLRERRGGGARSDVRELGERVELHLRIQGGHVITSK